MKVMMVSYGSAETHGDLYRVRSIDYTVLEANFLELLAAHGELAQVQV